jgi:hypothetical protein
MEGLKTSLKYATMGRNKDNKKYQNLSAKIYPKNNSL